jgi:hypothetical protein
MEMLAMTNNNKDKRIKINADEIMDNLEKDHTYITVMEEKRQKTILRQLKYQEAAKEIITDLHASDNNVQKVGDLIEQYQKSGIPYKNAIPILIEWLPHIEYIPLKEDIVRMLSVPWAKPQALGTMVREFYKVGDQNHSLRWAIGNAIEVLADENAFDDLVKIALDNSFGTDRQMVVLALAKMKNHDVVEVLIKLLGDEDVAGHAVAALRKLKNRSKPARPYLERFLKHPKAWIRKEARGALSAIEEQ